MGRAAFSCIARGRAGVRRGRRRRRRPRARGRGSFAARLPRAGRPPPPPSTPPHTPSSSSATTIHWHGMDQAGSAWADGVAGVTQAPVPPGATFRYRFKAEPAGTHWYHAHTGLQYADGLRGALIVEDGTAAAARFPPPANDRLLLIADQAADTADDVLKKLQEGSMAMGGPAMAAAAGGGVGGMGVMAPAAALAAAPAAAHGRRRLRQAAAAAAHGGGGAAPAPAPAPSSSSPDPGAGCGDAADQDISDAPYYGTTINGVGYALGARAAAATAPVVNVTAGDTYRLRVVNGAASWAFQVSVDGHEVAIGAVDGYPTAKAATPAVVLSAGETADLLLAADAPVANYWVRVLTLSGVGAVAVLHYEGAPDPAADAALGEPPVGVGCPALRPSGLDLKLAPLEGVPVAEGGMGAPPAAANRTLALYMTLNSGDAKAKPANLTITGFDRPEPPPGCPPRAGGGPSAYCWGINWVIFGESPGAGPVLERGPRWKATSAREYAVEAAPGEVLDLVFINPSIMVHPMHPHGAGGWLLGTGRGPPPLGADGRVDESKLNLVDPPFRSVVPVPNAAAGADGWAVLRFAAPGPGAWAMHCHVDYHVEAGMLLYFAVRAPAALNGGWAPPRGMDCRGAGRGRVDRGGGVALRPFGAAAAA